MKRNDHTIMNREPSFLLNGLVNMPDGSVVYYRDNENLDLIGLMGGFIMNLSELWRLL